MKLDRPINEIAWSPDGNHVAVAGSERMIDLIQFKNLEIVATLRGHTGAVNSLDWSPDGSRLASAGADRTIRLWNPRRGKAVVVLRQSSSVENVAWDPQGQVLASVNHDGELTTYRAGSTEDIPSQ